MRAVQTDIPDVVILESTTFSDERGWFMESFNEQQFHEQLKKLNLFIPRGFIQDNYLCSKKGVTRGVNYQLPPYAQGKLIRVTKGMSYDVAVDLRCDSNTFGKWVGVELSASNNRMLWIPEGFGHVFVSLEDDTQHLHKVTAPYNKAFERRVRWDDPDIGIPWADIVSEASISSQNCESLPFKEAEFFSIDEGSGTRLIDLKVIGDSRGGLVAFEKNYNTPFDIKRVYYIFNTKEHVSRGFHAHKKLRQLLVCVSGSCKVEVDDGEKRESFYLESPDKGLVVSGLIWREMHEFSEDCVLLVFADEYYNESDYIRDYSDFLLEVKSERE